jgi:hypothetical protein
MEYGVWGSQDSKFSRSELLQSGGPTDPVPFPPMPSQKLRSPFESKAASRMALLIIDV